jgi:hypothetical protein
LFLQAVVAISSFLHVRMVHEARRDAVSIGLEATLDQTRYQQCSCHTSSCQLTSLLCIHQPVQTGILSTHGVVHTSYTAVFNLCSSVSLLHASGVLLEFPVTVLSVLKCTFGFAFCRVAVYTMILCSCRPLEVVFVTCNELSPKQRAKHSTQETMRCL